MYTDILCTLKSKREMHTNTLSSPKMRGCVQYTHMQWEFTEHGATTVRKEGNREVREKGRKCTASITHLHRGFKETAKYWVQTELAGLWAFLLYTIEPVQYLLTQHVEMRGDLCNLQMPGDFWKTPQICWCYISQTSNSMRLVHFHRSK